VRAAAARGLTHLAITDHDRIDGALEARTLAETEAPRLTLIVGQEIRTTAGDLIGLFLHEAVPVGLPPSEAIAAVHAQGGLVGIAHPFDRFRGSVGRGEAAALEEVAAQVDWIEAWNARLMLGDGNARAAELAVRSGKPGIAVSDAHTTLEVGIASTILRAVGADPSTADGLREALAGPLDLVTGRASRLVRLVGPAAKLVQRARGRGRVPARMATR
jgi:predicted metal-dependent phosphoesterase TrpH